MSLFFNASLSLFVELVHKREPHASILVDIFTPGGSTAVLLIAFGFLIKLQ